MVGISSLGVLATVAGRQVGVDRLGHPVVALQTAFPYVAVVALVLLLAAVALRRWRPAAVAAVAVVASVAALAPRALPGPTPAVAPDGPEITVMAANLLFGRADQAALADAVARHEVDVLAVVELTEPAAASIGTGPIGEQLPFVEGRTARAAAGSAIWSRFELVERGEVQLNRGFAMPIVDVAVPGAAPVELTGVHPWPPTSRFAVERWEDAFARMPRPGQDGPGDDRVRILAGDFNASLDHRVMRDLLADGYVDAADAVGQGLVPTYTGIGVPVPPITIDHVLVDERVEVLEVTVEDLPASDHRLVIARLRLPSG